MAFTYSLRLVFLLFDEITYWNLELIVFRLDIWSIVRFSANVVWSILYFLGLVAATYKWHNICNWFALPLL